MSAFVNGDITSGYLYLESVVISAQSARLINRSNNIVGLFKPLLEYNIRLKLSGGKRLIND